MDKLPELTKCALCASNFSSRVGRGVLPHVIPCGHSICGNCLEKNLKKPTDRMNCPVCQETVTTSQYYSPDKMQNEFPINYYMVGVIHMNNQMTTDDSRVSFSNQLRNQNRLWNRTILKCHECTDRRADFRCNECRVPYCTVCFSRIHNTAKAFKNHTVSENQIDMDVLESEMHCITHKDQVRQMWCDSCQEALCYQCYVSNHNQHPVSLLSEKNSKCFKDLVSRHVHVVNILNRLKATRKSAELKLRPLDCQPLPVEVKIHSHFTRLVGVLIARQTQLLRQLYSPRLGAANNLKAIMSHIDSSVQELSRLVNMSSMLIQNDEKYRTSASYQDVLAALRLKEDTPCHLLVSEQQHSSRLVYEEDTLVKQLRNHATLYNESEVAKYRLVTEDELPPDYSLELIKQVTSESVLSNAQRLGLAASVDSLTSSSSTSAASTQSSNPNEEVGSVKALNKHTDELVPGCSVKVTLSHAISPSHFFVQRHGAVKKLKDMELQFLKIVSKRKPLQEISVGCIYLVQYTQNKKWYRGKVISKLQDFQFKVRYIDYGNDEVVTQDKLRSLPVPFIKLDGFALQCCLHNCIPISGNQWQPEALSTMIKIISRSPHCLYGNLIPPHQDCLTLKVYKKSGNILYVDLLRYDPHGYVSSVQESLLFLGVAKFIDTTECTRMASPLPDKKIAYPSPLKAGSSYTVRLSHIISPSLFFVHEESHIKSLDELTVSMNEFYKKKTDHLLVFNPKEGMFVAAKYSGNNKWYRAVVTGISAQKTVTVHYVDLGKEETITWKRLNLLESRFYNTPRLCWQCRLVEIEPLLGQDWSREATQAFSAMVTNPNCRDVGYLKMVVQGCEGILHGVVLFQDLGPTAISFNGLLVSEGYAVSTGYNSALLEIPNLPLSDFPPESDHNSSINSSGSGEASLMTVSNVVMTKSNKAATVCSLKRIDQENDLKIRPSKETSSVKVAVIINKIISPSEFYITHAIMIEELNQFKEDLQQFYQENFAKLKKKDVNVGDQCVVRHPENGWCRAVVFFSEPPNVKVMLPDYGDRLELEASDVYELKSQFAEMRDGVIRCRLAGLTPPLQDQWPMTAKDDFFEFVSNSPDNIYITKMGEVKDHTLPVEVLSKQEKVAGPWEPTKILWTSFNNSLKRRGLALSDGSVEWDSEDTFETTKKDSSALKSLEKLDSIKYAGLTFFQRADKEDETDESSYDLTKELSNLGNFPCKKVSQIAEDELKKDVSPTITVPEMPKEWLPHEPFAKLEFIATATNVDEGANLFLQDFQKSVVNLNKIGHELEANCINSLPMPYDLYWSVGNTCIAKYHVDNKWYRGVIKSVTDDNKLMVSFVDYGNVEECSASELRKMPLTVDVPIQGRFCRLTKIISNNAAGRWTIPELDIIHSLIVDKHVQVKLSLDSNGQYFVEQLIMPDGSDALANLISMGLAKYNNKANYPVECKKVIEEGGETLKEDISLTQTAQQDETKTKDLKKDDVTDEKLLQEINQDFMNVSKTKKSCEDRTEKEENNEDVTGKDDCCNNASEENTGKYNWCDDVENDDSFEDVINEKDESHELAEVVDEGDSGGMDDSQSSKEGSFLEVSDKDDIPATILSVSPSVVRESKTESKHISYTPIKIPKEVQHLTVDVNGILSPTSVYVNVVESQCAQLQRSREAFLSLMKTLQKEASKQPTISKLETGMLCCGQFTVDNDWYRGRVEEVRPGGQHAVVQYVDYGNMEELPISRLREIHSDWLRVESQAMCVRLDQVEAVDRTEKCLNALVDALLGRAFNAVIKDINEEGKLTVQLFSNNKLAYIELIEKGFLSFSHS